MWMLPWTSTVDISKRTITLVDLVGFVYFAKLCDVLLHFPMSWNYMMKYRKDIKISVTIWHWNKVVERIQGCGIFVTTSEGRAKLFYIFYSHTKQTIRSSALYKKHGYKPMIHEVNVGKWKSYQAACRYQADVKLEILKLCAVGSSGV
jgi:hypothetical protein